MSESMVRKQRRRNAIDTVKLFMKANPSLKNSDLIFSVMSRLDVSYRTAREYVMQAAAELGVAYVEIPTWITSDVKRAEVEEKEMREGRGNVKEVDETE